MDNKKDITLSVVVLSYNNEQYIEDCLNSIANQGIDSYEVFVVDDSSTDNSAEVIKNYIKDHPQFELIVKPNSGGALSSQIGISKANGKYVALVDSDDIVADGAYKKLIARIEEDGSDFASGIPMRMVNGFMHKALNDQQERDVFATDCVLENKKEIEDYTRQVFYWNAVYKTDFLRDNNVEMPAHLLIADRIFMYKAVMKAKKISVISDVVYYWRKKENSNKISITDQTAEFHMIADRCDSFEAQMKICIDEFKENNEYNKSIWENSFIRLYYPLYEIADEENEAKDYEDFVEACERYRLFLLQYKAFFNHLVMNSDIPLSTKYVTERILTKQYKALYQFMVEKDNVAQLDVERYDSNIYNAMLRLVHLISVRTIEQENGRTYIKLQLVVNSEDKEELDIMEVFAYNRYFEQKKIILPYDPETRRIDITDLNDATYILAIKCKHRSDIHYYIPQVAEELAKVKKYTFGESVVTYNTGTAILTLQRKNRFTLLDNGEDKYLLGVNYPEDVKEMFFFNVAENIRIPVESKDNLYSIDVNALPDGDNVLIYKTKDDLYTTVRKVELSNSDLDSEMVSKVIVRGKIEFEKGIDEILDSDDALDE